MFGLSKLRGGVHPVQMKDLTQHDILHGMPVPKRLVMPLFQQANAQAIPIVKVGDTVAKGQCIAVSTGKMAANLHAPTSGVITGLETIVAPHPSGLPTHALIIESDGEDRWLEPPERKDPFSMAPEELATLVEEAGVVGLGGAVFPSALKLRLGRRFEIKTLIINGSECEPYLTTDDHLMREHAEEIVEGARLIKHILEAYEVIIGIEDNKPEAIAALRKAAEPFGSVEVKTVPAIYPMGSAKQLIQSLTGKEVPAGGRSNDLGILVQNVGTVHAVQQALCWGRPLISRVMTVSGGCVNQPHNVNVRLGTSIQEVLDFCGGLDEAPARLLMGGPMMGQVLPSTNVPVMKGTSGILALTKKEVNERLPSPCIRCSRCLTACPMGLMPMEMARQIKGDDIDSAQSYGLRDCILCGSCAYVCPSRIPLVNYFEHAKGSIRSRKNAEIKADYTQELTHGRSARMEAEAAAKKAAKEAKKKRAKAKKPAPKAEPAAETEDKSE